MQPEFSTQGPPAVRALLEGDAARSAWQAAEEVGETLARDEGIPGAALADGSIGIAVVLGNLGRMLQRPAWIEDARERLDHALSALAGQRLSSGLFAGFSGIAWGAVHLEREFFPEGEIDYDDLDEALVIRLRAEGRQDYDLIAGWVGIGAYALERWPHPRAEQLLSLVMERLRDSVEAAQTGVTWKTAPELLPPHQRLLAPNGYYNLGLAHGVPGVVALLAQAQLLGALTPGDSEMLEAAVDWLWSQRDGHRSGMQFRSWRTEPASESGSRLGWCYGDLGVAVALVSAGLACARVEWLREGVDLAKRAAQLDARHQGVRDHGLCHGYGGIAWVLFRLATATGDGELTSLARDWFRKTLERRTEVGIAGFATWRAGDTVGKPESEWQYALARDPGYLTGAGGVALALASAAAGDFLDWDRPLLLALPRKV